MQVPFVDFSFQKKLNQIQLKSISKVLNRGNFILGNEVNEFEKSEKLVNEILSLPIYPEMKPEMAQYVCDKIKKYFK